MTAPHQMGTCSACKKEAPKWALNEWRFDGPGVLYCGDCLEARCTTMCSMCKTTENLLDVVVDDDPALEGAGTIKLCPSCKEKVDQAQAIESGEFVVQLREDHDALVARVGALEETVGTLIEACKIANTLKV